MRKQISRFMLGMLVGVVTELSVGFAWAQPVPTTNLFVWLAADNVNGDDTNPANGAPVSTWVDLSGNGNSFSLTSYIGGTAPTYSVTGGPLGKPAVVFDGISNQLGLNNRSYTSPQIFMVMKGAAGTGDTLFQLPRVIGAGGANYLLWNLDPSGGIIGAAREHEDANYRTLSMPSATPSVADYKVLTLWTNIYEGADHPGYPQWLSAHMLSAGQDITTEGTPDEAYGTVNYPEVAITYPANPHNYYDLVLGENIDFSKYANMSIAELLIYQNPNGFPMSTADRTAVETYLYNKYMVSTPMVPGDFDTDGDVDGADFVAWQTNFPKASGATLAEGDADGDGDVDGADFVVWQTHFPFTPGPGATPVPEPTAFSFAIAAMMSFGFLSQSRRLHIIVRERFTERSR